MWLHLGFLHKPGLLFVPKSAAVGVEAVEQLELLQVGVHMCGVEVEDRSWRTAHASTLWLAGV